MPKTSKSRSSGKKLNYRQTGVLSLIVKRIYVFIPLFVLLLGGAVFKESLNKATETSDFACSAQDFSGLFKENEKFAYFDDKQLSAPFEIPSFLANSKTTNVVLGVKSDNEKWIEVDLSDQSLTAHDGDSVYLETPISSGLARSPTPPGEYRIWSKLKATKMSGGTGGDYYYLPNVPYVMFFYNDNLAKMKGYSLHGTYWHNDFGRPRSHGCVNLPTPIAEKLYYWVNPLLKEGKSTVFASDTNPGTRIVIHE